MQLPAVPATKMKRFFELAFQQTQVTDDRLRRPGLPEADRHQRDDDAAARAERAAELRAHDAASSIAARPPAAPTAMTTHAAHDDDGAQGAVRVPRRLAGRRRRQGHRPLHAGAPEQPIIVETAAGPDPDRRHARPDEPELHALVRPGRRDQRRERRRLHRGSDRLPAERASRCTTCSTARSTGTRAATGVQLPALGRHRARRRSSTRPTSPTGRW